LKLNLLRMIVLGPSRHVGPLLVLVLVCLSLLVWETECLLSASNSHFLSPRIHPHNHIPSRQLQPIVPSPSLTECKSKQDSTSDIDKEEEFRAEIQETETPKDSPQLMQNFSTPTVLLAAVFFVAFWPLLALLRSTTSPIDGFDIDMFMALKRIIDTTPMDGSDPTIVELPSLSPAEQLVGAIFGPPQ